MGPTDRRERQRQEMRRKILDAAREIFVSEGREAVTMRRIADKIEYTATALYTHFENKQQLLHELCESDFFAFAAEFMKGKDLEDPVDFLKATARFYVNFAITHPSHFRFLFMSPAGNLASMAGDPRMGNPQSDPYAYVRQAVEMAQQAGVLREELTDVSLVAQTIWAGIHGVAMIQATMIEDSWVDWRPLDVRLEAMLDVLLRGLSREGAAGHG